MSGFGYNKDDDGIVTVTMDMDGRVNTMNTAYLAAMGGALDRLERESGLAGVVLASAKATFFAGGDIGDMLEAKPADAPLFFQRLVETKAQLRRLEQLPVPVVAAINGAALGGGFEICLACNYRIVIETPAAVVGLPEIKLGLLPGGGGTVRLVRLLGLGKALPILLEGAAFQPAAALAAGLVDACVADAAGLVPAAKAWLRSHRDAWQQPWDRSDYQLPGGSAAGPHMAAELEQAFQRVLRTTRGLLPAPARLIALAADSTCVNFDTALARESEFATALTLSPQAKNIMTTMFVHMRQVRKNTPRSAGTPLDSIAIVGGGALALQLVAAAGRAGIAVVEAGELVLEMTGRASAKAVVNGALLADLHAFLAAGELRLVEIVVAQKAPPVAMGKLQDFLHRAGILAILVDASTDGFSRRVLKAWHDEVARLHAEGIDPVLVAALAWKIGLPATVIDTPGCASVAACTGTLADSDIADRLLFRQAIEALRCLQEGVVRSVADANVASLLGAGAPHWTGGFIQLVNTYDMPAFAARASVLAQRYGERFSSPKILLDRLDSHAIFM